MRSKFKELSKNKVYTYALIVFSIIVLILGIKSAYAYYHDEQSFSILSALIGDFDGGDGDINIIIFKEKTKGKEDYVKTYGVPAMGYQWKQEKTECTFADNQKADCTNITTNSDGSGSNCTYKYDTDARSFSVTSNQKLTCKFYFEKTEESDINVYLMVPDDNGADGNHNNQNYRMVPEMPAYGYEFDGTNENYECYDMNDTGVTQNKNTDAKVTYDAENKKFTVETDKRTACYVYLKSVGSADIITKVYVKNKDDSDYKLVNSIPQYKQYKLSTEGEKTSSCKKADGNPIEEEVGNQISYDGEYITITDIGEKVECDVYLEEDTNTVG